jgi:NDP-sugar pyrophosphorylase family protein
MIVIPMAGASRRFSEAGYTKPKYMLKAAGRSLLTHSLSSFSNYFQTEPFLLICRDVMGTADFIKSEVEKLTIRNFQIITLESETRGQAETVAAGLIAAQTDLQTRITIFNIDTIRPGFEFPSGPEFTGMDGYLEVFEADGENWSFVRTDHPTSKLVIQTTEKKRISNHCCTGLYHFNHATDFMSAFKLEIQRGMSDIGEYYVAPLYNWLIASGKKIVCNPVARPNVILSGTPHEYELFCESLINRQVP